MTGQNRLLYIITNGEFGGAQTHVFDLAYSLQDRYDISVAMGVKGDLWHKLQRQGIKTFHLPHLVRSIAPLQDLLCVWEIWQLVRRLKPDLISLHSSKAGMLGRAAAWLTRTPVVFTAHGWAFTEGVPARQRALYTLLERWAGRFTDKIICVSEYDRRLALEQKIAQADNLFTVHNGLPDIEDPLPSPKHDGIVNIIMVARFSEQKDQDLLIRAAAKLQDCCFRLQLVGDGPRLEECKALVRQLRLEDKVVFTGGRDDVPVLLAAGDIFVLTSFWEGFPRSILEAMRARLPVVASRVGGVDEAVIDEETGFLIPRGAEEQLVHRLRTLIQDPRLRQAMGACGRQKFGESFSFAAILQRTLYIYDSVLERNPLAKAELAGNGMSLK